MSLNWYNPQDNGWFKERTDANGNMLYAVHIPESGVNSNTTIQIFSVNPGDFDKTWFNYVENNQNPNCIYMVIPSIQDGTTTAADYFADRVLSITSEYNIPTENINMFSWSNGNKGSSALASALNDRGYTIGRYVNVFGNFPGTNSNTFYSNFETGTSAVSPYIYIDDGSNQTGIDNFKENCSDYIVIKIKNPHKHSFYTADEQYNFVDFFVNGGELSGEYEITRYVNGEAQTMSYDELVKVVNTSSIEILKEKYTDLKDFATFFMGSDGSTLASSLAYVSNSMSDLQGQLVGHTDLNYQKPSETEANVVGAMYSATNYYGSVTNVLYGNLKAETEAVYTIANAIYQMDGCAAQIAESTLTDGISGLYDTSNPAIAAGLEDLNRVTSELVDTARNAITATDRYNALTTLLTEPEPGKGVGSISITSLEGTINAVVPSLDDEVNRAQGLKAGVDDFISGIGANNILQGEVWDNVRTNMESYQNLLDCNMKAANFISDTIKSAMGILVEYINGSSDIINAVAGTDYGMYVSAGELDDSHLPALEGHLSEIKIQISELDAKIKEMKKATELKCTIPTESEPTTSCHPEPKYTAADIAPFEKELEEYKELEKTLESYVDRLRGLAPLVAKVQKMINDAIAEVRDAYANPVENTPGNFTFRTDFELDLSKYEFDHDANYYKNLINDYYEKLNPKEPDSVLDEEPGKKPPKKDPYGGPGNTPVGDKAPTTEGSTEAVTDVGSETVTESAPEKITEVYTEVLTEVMSEVLEEKQVNNNGNKNYSPKDKTEEYYEPLTTEPIVEIPDDAVVDLEFPSENEFIESVIEEPVISRVSVTNPKPVDNSVKNVRTMGIATGVGVALGAAALGTHSIIKSKEEDEEEDKGYDK